MNFREKQLSTAYLKRQQNELTYGKSVTITERVLCFYCYWLCWVDIAVGLLV